MDVKLLVPKLWFVACAMAASVSWAQSFSMFQRQVLTDQYYCDGVAAADINGDGKIDIVAGPFWYQGPDFKTAHEFYPAEALPREPSPSNSMFSFVHDFNGDGRPDILVLGRVHKHPATWYQNPGPVGGLWQSHFAFERVRGESPTMIDLDGDGIPQVICHWEGRWGSIQPNPDTPTQPWSFHAIGDDEGWAEFYHGEGVGDLNSDGKLDLIINDGWYEQPSDPSSDSWTFHRHQFSNDRGGAQMFARDVDGDGDQDVISAINAHGWGLAWYEQTQSDAGVRFHQHLIMGDRSQEQELGVAFTQPHALDVADIDGDGHDDIITGKRMWAHGPTGDIEPGADPVLYWFQWTRDENGKIKYVPTLIDDRSGVGVQVLATDVNQDGRIDVVTASKLGTFVFISHHETDSRRR